MKTLNKKKLLLYSINVWLLIHFFSCNISTDSNSTKSETTKLTPVSGGAFRMMLHRPQSLDPLFVTTIYECCIIEQIFNGLVKFDANLSPVPDLAEAWFFSEDKTVLTFKLKKDVHFHNGRELVAQDVVYSFSRLFDPALNVPTTIKQLMQSVKGVQEFQNGEVDSISGFKAVDKNTFQIYLSQPNSSILTMLAISYFKVIPGEDIQSFSQQPVGSGPFKFEYRESEEAIILTRNENYFDHKAYLDSIIFVISEHERESKLFDKFCNEKLDVLDVSRRLNADALRKENYHLLRRLKLGIGFIGLNLQAPNLKDIRMRQAIAYAINRKAIVNQNKETYTVASGLFPAGLPGYQPQQKCYPYNPEKARQLLSELKLEIKDKLQCWTIIPDTSNKYFEVPEIIKQNLADVGIEIEIKAVSSSELISTIKNGETVMFLIALVAGTPLPEEYLANTFSAAGGDNFFNYDNPEVDMLIDSSKHVFNFSEKIKLLQLAEQQIINDVPIIPLFYTSNAYLIQNYIYGIELGPLGIANIPMEKIWKKKK